MEAQEQVIIEPPSGGSTKKQMIRDTAITMGTRGLQFGSIFVKSIIMARVLGPGGFGVYKLVILLYDLMFSYGRLGVSEAIVFHAGKQKESLEKYVGNVITLALVVSLILATLLGLFLGVLQQTFFDGVPLVPILIIMAMLPAGLTLAYLSAVLQSQREVVQFNIIQGLVSVIHLTAILVALLVFKAGVTGAVIATTFSIFIPFIIAVVRVSRMTRLRFQWDWETIKSIVSFGLKSHTQFVMGTTIDKMDVPIMNLFLDPAAVGIYGVAQSLVGRTLNMPTAVSTALYPHLVASDTDDAMNTITETACRNLMAMVTAIALVGVLVGQQVIILMFGQKYAGAYIPFLLLLLAMIPQGSYQILNRSFASRGKPLLGAIPTAIALVVNLVGDFVLIPRMGIIGAGVATLAGAVCLITSGVIIYSIVSKRPWWNVVIIQPSDLHAYVDLTRRLGQRVRSRSAHSAGTD